MNLRDKLSNLAVKPEKILKIVIGLSVVLLLMWLLTLSHMDYPSDNKENSFPAGPSADSVFVKDSLLASSNNSHPENRSTNMFSNGLLTFFILLLILGGIWLWLHQKESNTPHVKQRELGSQVLGEGAQLKIIAINNEVWVLGVTSNSVNLLHRYSKADWTEKAPEDEPRGPLFKKLFRSEMG